jgi:two-component system, LuxR family, sensor kinase FixL
MTQLSENKILRNRQFSFAATFFTLIAIYFLFKDINWQGSKYLHTIFETIATLLALGAGLLALVRYYTKKNSTYLLIGAAFIGTGFLDGYHTVVTSEFFHTYFPSPPENLIPWSWNASRFFLAITMYANYLIWKMERRPSNPYKLKEKNVYMVFGAFTLFSFLFFLIVPLPRAYYPEQFFGRPEELFAALFFLLALIGFYKKGWWKNSAFEFWIVISLIIGFTSQAVFMPFSVKLFDFQFDMAHLLKKVSYLCVHTGLLISFYYLFRDSEKQKIQILAEIKERELAEKNMAKYRGRNELILNSAVEGIIGLDLEGRHTFVNPAAQEILGFTEEEMLGQPSHDQWHHSNDDGSRHNVNDCIIYKSMIDGSVIQNVKDSFWHKSGRVIHVEYTASPLKQNNKIVGAMLVFQDVTKIRHSEEKLHKLSHVVEQIPNAVIITDLDAKIEYVNPAFTKSSGYSPDEIIGQNPRIFRSEENKNNIESLWPTLVKGETWKGELCSQKKNGEIYWEFATISPLKNKQGITTHYMAIKTDISNQKRYIAEIEEAREKLWHSENLIKMILDQIPQRIFWKDKNYKYLGANKLFAADAGFSKSEELIGRDDEQMPWKEIAHLYREDDRTVIQDGKVKINFEEPFIDNDGNEQWVRTSKQPLIDQDGNIFGVLGNFEDITERKKAEQSLKEYAYALEKSNKELEDFAHIASHDLQEPLRKVITFGNRLKDKYAAELPENAQDYLNRMQSASERMKTLINDLLDFSRITSRGKEFEEVKLNELIADVLNNLEVKVEAENAQFAISDLGTIEGDYSQLYRLVQNIISNALKYRKTDTDPLIRIYSRTANRERQEISTNLENNYCHLYIKDNGIGFDEKYLDKIFAPFQRLHGRREYEGTGMGLAICSKIVSRHNGMLTAKSAPGQGSTFIISLPVAPLKGKK